MKRRANTMTPSSVECPNKRKTKIILYLLATCVLLASFSVPLTEAGQAQTYIVLFKQQSVPPNASLVITKAGGKLVYCYDDIGVVIATSSKDEFADNLKKYGNIEGVSSTAGFASQLSSETVPMDNVVLESPITWGDPLSPNQWDMFQIHVPEAHEINAGSPSVVVGDIDTGLDYTHPDLAANVDFSDSVSCVSGVPNSDPAAWNDDNGHGTYTAGIIAAANNGIGIIGVAPNVKIAGIKVGNADGFFFPEAVICGFMWAADHNIDVVNNGYFADPWLFNCRNEAGQRVIWKAEQRAIRYAISKGVTIVAQVDNENMDLAHPTVDDVSPTYPPGSAITRDVNNACVVIPTEIPGVIGVSANGNLLQKSYYSNYGVGVVQLVAPGGDSSFQRTAEAPRGTILSTYPGNRYAYAQGTMAAASHVSGVAALVISRFGKMSPGKVQAYMTSTADSQPCPPNPFDPGGTGAWEATCQGGMGYNSFYGHGQVNALSAVTHNSGQ
jgi:subtilisin family serine protease